MAVRFMTGLLALMVGFLSSSANAASLGDTAWQLVEIASMNDTVDTPADPAQYTLELKADGTALIQADCNRGRGSWSSESDGQLQFGPIASTKALCPPESLSEKYLAQFSWVRSYVMKEGHLFLATMADGSIIEFAPAEPIAASVFGEDIRTSDAALMQEAVLTKLFDRYANENDIHVEPSELNAFQEKMRQGMAEEGLTGDENLTAAEAEQVETMRRDMARSMIREWKINKALYEEYGGRIIYQQLGPEPIDAYRRFLEEQEREGAFMISDPSMVDAFWAYFKDETIHDFMKPGSADETRAFTVPPWETMD